VSWSLLSLGAGMLVASASTPSMLAGAILSWVVAPPLLLQNGVIDEAGAAQGAAVGDVAGHRDDGGGRPGGAGAPLAAG